MAKTVKTYHYGTAEYQEADLYLPHETPAKALICLLHGGFWRAPYNRHELTPLASYLSSRGFAVWNIDYRSVGSSGGWPNTFYDVAQAIDYLRELSQAGVDLPLDRVVVAGHSAGGQLALWSAKRHLFPNVPVPCVSVRAVVGLAPVADMETAHELAVGRSAVAEFLGGTPQTVKARFAISSPDLLLPLGVPQLIIHGEADSALPSTLSRSYVEAAIRAGDVVEFIEPPLIGHMDFLDPESEAVSFFVRRLERM